MNIKQEENKIVFLLLDVISGYHHVIPKWKPKLDTGSNLSSSTV
jgi:hypothetical protein